jgi:hypothetical protein
MDSFETKALSLWDGTSGKNGFLRIAINMSFTLLTAGRQVCPW